MTFQDDQEALGAEVAESARRFLRSEWSLDDGRTGEPVEVDTVRRLRGRVALLGWGEIAWRDRAEGALESAPVLRALFTELGRHPAPLSAFDVAVWLPVLQGVGATDDSWGSATGAWQVGAAFGGSSGHRRPVWSAVHLRNGLASGSVGLVPYADALDAFLVPAQDEGQPCILLVDRAQPGVRVETMRSYDRLERLGSVGLANTPVRVICRAEDAQRAEQTARALAACAASAELTGLCSAALAMGVEYVKVRTQFGRPIGSFQAIKHLLADAAIEVHAMESSARSAARQVAEAASAADAAGISELVLGVTVPACRRVMEAVLQAHGGIGFTLEHGFSWYFNRALSRCSTFGASYSMALIGRDLIAGAGRGVAP
jgi:hypothetical protein